MISTLFRLPESMCSIAPFFFKSAKRIAEAKELEGEKGGVIVETLDSGEMLQSVATLETLYTNTNLCKKIYTYKSI